MKDYLFQLMQNTKTLTLEQMCVNILMAVVLGAVIYLSYWITHAGTIYSKKFNVSLIMLTVLTATVMAVIGNNVALSLGMVGALSIVRYRTAIKDSRDTAYIFWAIIGGICCGSGDYLIGAVGSSAVFLVLLLLGRIKNDNRILLVIHGSLGLERDIEAIVFKVFAKRARLRVKNTTPQTIELIYEITSKAYEKANRKAQGGESSVIADIYALGDIQSVNLVTQTDEIV